MNDSYEHLKNILMPLLREIGMINIIRPQQRHYDYAVVLGSRVATLRRRLSFLVDQFKAGVRFDSLVFLSGERVLPRAEQVELKALLPDGSEVPHDERMMVRAVYKHSSMPTAMRALPVTFIEAPPVPGQSRARTDDTINAWNRVKPVPGSVMAVSSQPYIGYQEAALHALLPSSFTIEGVGPASDESSIAVVLDSFARWLYAANNLVTQRRHHEEYRAVGFAIS